MSTDEWSGFGSADSGLSPEIARFMSPRDGPELREAVVAGARAGAVAAVIAASLLIYTYARHGGSMLLPVRLVALQFTGDAAFAGGVLGIALSSFICLAGGAGFGALFGVLISLLVGRMGLLAVTAVGVVYGVLLWIVTQFVVVAYMAPQALMLYDQHLLALCYGVYGACLGLMGRAFRTSAWIA